MDFDALTLSRLQFALTVMFHYLFPPLTIGLGGLMVSLEAMYLKTGDRQYEQAARFWTKIFAVNFAMGVATGIVMEFQFGTNWSTYSRFVGDVFGSALAAEGIFAFFLESGFLAVLVFGWDRVSPKMHFFAACMVALGAVFSSIWIVVANSWQQTPAGFHLVGEGAAMRAEITDFWAMVFNPSSVHRLLHVLIGCYILAAFFVMSISAYYLLRGRHVDFAKKSFGSALILATGMSLAALVQGDIQARKLKDTQPAKLAAMEAHFHTGTGGTPLYVFGLPDEEKQTVKYGLAIPKLLSLLVHGNTREPVAGLDRIPRSDWPPVAMTFHSFHLMVGLGFFFIAVSLLACFLWWRGTLFQTRWLLWVFVWSIPLPYLANQLGWVAAEVGRQPWVVYGLMRTTDGVSKVVSAPQTLGSIILFSLIYALLFAVFLYVLNDKIQHGPDPVTPGRPGGDAGPGGLAAVTGLRAGTGGASLTMPGDGPAPADSQSSN
ncbi:MAG TPA: cytochrome ubiquinol oxidase subunit I [Candidatus Paceibacterota bacterium]|nr:cytochrome ubiquinol oxidase subunit I [Candidatus Paceibacterota bacterium]